MVEHDPNGEPWEDWKRFGYASYESWIESKAGACPPEWALRWPERLRSDLWLGRDWPQPVPPPYPADDEGEAEPDE